MALTLLFTLAPVILGTMTRSDLAFSCVLLKQPRGFAALCLDLDVASEGATAAKAKRMLQEAVEIYLDSAIDNNLPYLRSVPPDEDPRKTESESIIESFNLRVDLSVQVHA
jgi:predicted RNase H-like HicB family nuclease